MRVLITGAAGRIGRKTVEAAVAAGHDVVATDAVFHPGLPVRLRLADLCDEHAAYELLEGVDAVIHLGNVSNAYNISPAQRVFTQNMTINVNLFAAMMHLNIPRVVFVSTIQAILGHDMRFEVPGCKPAVSHVYLPRDGCEALNPGLNMYALSKAFSEQTLETMAASRPELVATSVRLPYIASNPEKVRAYRSPLNAANPHLADNIFYLLLEDAASVLLACLGLDAPGHRTYMPCQVLRPRGMTARRFAEICFPQVELRPSVDEVDSLSDIRRITADTGWTPSQPPVEVELVNPA